MSNHIVTKPVEFSRFYRILNAAKEGEEGKDLELESILKEYQNAENSDSPLHHLGQVFLHVGIMELYKYAESENIEHIGLINKEKWEELANEKKADLPPHIANSMIRFAQKNNLAKKISNKWDGTMTKREIEQNIMQMARYLTEGILDAID